MYSSVYPNDELWILCPHMLPLSQWSSMESYSPSRVYKNIPYKCCQRPFHHLKIQYKVPNSIQCFATILCEMWLSGQCWICLGGRLHVHPLVICQWHFLISPEGSCYLLRFNLILLSADGEQTSVPLKAFTPCGCDIDFLLIQIW